MANRNQYTYTPGYAGAKRGKAANQGSGPQTATPTGQAWQGYEQDPQRQAEAPRRNAPQPANNGRPIKDTAMFAMVLFVVPLIGIIGILYRPLLWFFVVVTLLCLVSLWVFRCFAQGTRAFFSGILLVLSILSLVAAIDLAPKQTDFPTYAAGGNFAQMATEPPSIPSAQDNDAGLAGLGDAAATPTAPIDLMGGGVDDLTNTEGGEGTPADQFQLLAANGDNPQTATGEGEEGGNAAPINQAVSAAYEALENYLQQWKARDYEEMVKYTLPSWRNAQQAPQQQLYWNHNWWILNAWTITSEATSPTADSASFKVVCDMNKSSNTRDPARQQFNAIVIQESGTWYVDPDSMRTGIAVTEDTTADTDPDYTAAQTAQPEPTIDPNTKLWYNSEGGEYYHADDKCSTINEKYYSKMQAFSFSELSESPYSKLKPCTKCGAPKE